jgi:hypothetical protein
MVSSGEDKHFKHLLTPLQTVESYTLVETLKGWCMDVYAFPKELLRDFSPLVRREVTVKLYYDY